MTSPASARAWWERRWLPALCAAVLAPALGVSILAFNHAYTAQARPPAPTEVGSSDTATSAGLTLGNARLIAVSDPASLGLPTAGQRVVEVHFSMSRGDDDAMCPIAGLVELDGQRRTFRPLEFLAPRWKPSEGALTDCGLADAQDHREPTIAALFVLPADVSDGLAIDVTPTPGLSLGKDAALTEHTASELPVLRLHLAR